MKLAGFKNGRQSFHPIPCGSRDRPGERSLMKAKLCVDTALAKSSSCVFPSTGKTAIDLVIFSHIRRNERG